MGGGPLAALDELTQLEIEAVAPPDHVDADGLLEAALRLSQQVATQQCEQAAHFATRATPVRGREGIQGKGADPPACGGGYDGIDCLRTRAMTCRTWQMTPRRPTAITVHDDRDMHLEVTRSAGGFDNGLDVIEIAIQGSPAPRGQP